MCADALSLYDPPKQHPNIKQINFSAVGVTMHLVLNLPFLYIVALLSRRTKITANFAINSLLSLSLKEEGHS